MNGYKSKFTDNEFADKVSGTGGIHDSLREKLEAARNIAGIPFIISSGFRSIKTQNELVAQGLSELTSSHPKGLAVDVKAESSVSRFKIVDAALRAGIIRIGIGKGFIHLDVDTDKPPYMIWTYEV